MPLRFSAQFLGVTFVVLCPVGAQDARARVPDAKTQSEVRARMLAAYGETGKSVQEKRDRAARLAKDAAQSQEPDYRFVLLNEAANLAAEIGDSKFVVEYIDRLVESFPIDPIATKLDRLRASASHASEKGAKHDAARSLIDVADAAVASGRLRAARAALEAAWPPSKHEVAGSRLRVARKLRLDSLADLGKLQVRANTARKELEVDAKNERPHLDLGVYLCFVECKWAESFFHLQRGADGVLAKVARLELREPKSGKDRFELAKSWFDLYEAARRGKQGLDRWKEDRCAQRASHWFKLAVPDLDAAIERPDAESRLDSLARRDPWSGPGRPEVSRLGSELLVNSGCEERVGKDALIPGWTDPGNHWHARNEQIKPHRANDRVDPQGGNYYFAPTKNNNPRAELYQDVDVSRYRSSIDSPRSRIHARFRGFVHSLKQRPSDETQVAIEFYGTTKRLEGGFVSDPIKHTNGWGQVEKTVQVPGGTRRIRIRLISIRKGARAKVNNGYFDSLSLILVDGGAK